MDENFIPIDVITENNKNEIWYINISELNISELITLKNQLKGDSPDSIPVIDLAIYHEIGYSKSKGIKQKELKKENQIRRRNKKFHHHKRHH